MKLMTDVQVSVFLMIWDELQQEAIRKSIPSFCKCLHASINAKGGHFEHTL